MATHTSLASLFGAIADAIRAKTGSSAQIVADDFPDEIAAISGGGGASGVVYITDELDENGGIVRNITTDGATITDTVDAHGGIVRSITGAEVRLQVKRVTPGATEQVITADAGFGALGKVIVEAANEMMIVEIVNDTADHTFAEIFEALQDGTPVFLHLPTEATLEDYVAYNGLMPVISAFKYDAFYRVLASYAEFQNITGNYGATFTPALYNMQATGPSNYPTFLRILYPSGSNSAASMY